MFSVLFSFDIVHLIIMFMNREYQMSFLALEWDTLDGIVNDIITDSMDGLLGLIHLGVWDRCCVSEISWSQPRQETAFWRRHN